MKWEKRKVIKQGRGVRDKKRETVIFVWPQTWYYGSFMQGLVILLFFETQSL